MRVCTVLAAALVSASLMPFAALAQSATSAIPAVATHPVGEKAAKAEHKKAEKKKEHVNKAHVKAHEAVQASPLGEPAKH